MAAAPQPFIFDVSDPEKRDKDTRLSYWVYRIKTTTTLDQYVSKEFVCTRRYNDFFWLREALVAAHPGIIVPPIPEKDVKGALEKLTLLSVDAKDLVEFRSRALRKFLVRVGAHPALCKSSTLQDFLTLSEEFFNNKKNRKEEKAAGAVKTGRGRSLSQRVSEGVYSARKPGSEETEEASSNISSAQVWQQREAYIRRIQASLVALKDLVELVVAKRREAATSLGEFGKAMAKLGEFEQGDINASQTNSINDKVGRGQPSALPEALIQVGQQTDRISVFYKEQAEHETLQVVETLTYYLGMCSAVLGCLKNVEDLTLTRDTLQYKKTSLADKPGKDANELSELEAKLADADAALHDVEDTLREELVRFHREKQFDMRQVVKALVDLQVTSAVKLRNEWNSVAPTLAVVEAKMPQRS